MEPRSPALQVDSLPAELPGRSCQWPRGKWGVPGYPRLKAVRTEVLWMTGTSTYGVPCRTRRVLQVGKTIGTKAFWEERERALFRAPVLWLQVTFRNLWFCLREVLKGGPNLPLLHSNRTSLGLWKCSSVSRESDCSAGDLGSGRPPGEGNGNPLQHSCLENPMDRGAWLATFHRVAKSQSQLSTQHPHSIFPSYIIQLHIWIKNLTIVWFYFSNLSPCAIFITHFTSIFYIKLKVSYF